MSKKSNPREKSVEDYLKKRCRELNVFTLKNTGMNGIPDRLLIKDNLVVFLELKRPGEKPGPLQKALIRKLRRHGVLARWADDRQKIDELLELFEAPPHDNKSRRRQLLLAKLARKKISDKISSLEGKKG